MTDFAEYHVVLLVEEALSKVDAEQVRSLHVELEQPVTYHVLVPMDDAPARIEAAMGTIGAGDLAATPGVTLSPEEMEQVREECAERSETDLSGSLAALTACGASVQGEVVTDSPVDALAAAVAKHSAQEAIILTRPHVVSEFFHVDWTSKARRRLGVPVLHLLERETFDEQAGGGEGATLI